MKNNPKKLIEIQIGKRYSITGKTAGLFIHKTRDGIAFSSNYPMKSKNNLEGFVYWLKKRKNGQEPVQQEDCSDNGTDQLKNNKTNVSH